MICLTKIEARTPLNSVNISHRPEPSVKNETYINTKDRTTAISKMILVIKAVVGIVLQGF